MMEGVPEGSLASPTEGTLSPALVGAARAPQRRGWGNPTTGLLGARLSAKASQAGEEGPGRHSSGRRPREGAQRRHPGGQRFAKSLRRLSVPLLGPSWSPDHPVPTPPSAYLPPQIGAQHSTPLN